MKRPLNLVYRLLPTLLALVSGPAVSNYHHTPNGLGELIKQTDARGYESVMFYDTLGRLSERREYEGSTAADTNPFITQWSYDGTCGANGPNGTPPTKGKLCSVATTKNGVAADRKLSH
jgi:YD repeat-containing protein